MMLIMLVAKVVLLAAVASSTESFEGGRSSGQHCPLDHFQCAYDRECILADQRCDGSDDCSDGTDEKNCELYFCKQPDYFKCDNGVCIDQAMVCNGEVDCKDGSDEHLCIHHISDITNQKCLEDQFECADKMCISKDWVCDGSPECLDASDESPSLCAKRQCDSNEFQCHNKECILKEFQCDGTGDCADRSDEENCPSRVVSMEHCTLDNKLFQCKDRLLCMELYQLCNGHADCFDGSDEGGNCSNIAQCHDSQCNTQHCYSSPDGPLCVCAEGFNLQNGSCVDIDECQEYGICDQKCENAPGSYRCHCDVGYKLHQDKRTCRGEGPIEPLIYFSLRNEIRVMFLKSGMYHVMASNLSQVIGVEFDGEHLYWSNVYEGEEAIMRAEMLGTDKRAIVTAGLGEPEDLAVDWITQNIYFTDSKNQFIGVCTNNGQHCAVLHNRDINNPRGIALLPKESYMFWSDWGKKPVIARSGMDGSDVMDFVSENLGWPNGITIDHGNERLYWVDAKLSTIESIRLDRTDRRKVLEKTVHHPYSIAVFEDTLYWSDWETLKIESANKFTGKNRKTIVHEKYEVYGIHIYHPALQDTDQINYCFASPCTDLCLLAPDRGTERRYTCACPEGKILAANNHSCIQTEKRKSIVIASRDRLFLYEHQLLGRQHIEELPLDQRSSMIGDIGALEYNSLDGSIIVSDVINRKLTTINLDTLQTTDIVTSHVGRIEGIAFDNLGSNIYWADSELGKVEVINTHNHHRKTIMDHLQGDVPMGVAVIPSEGVMFVSLFSPHGAHIDKVSMANGDVSSRNHIFEEHISGPFVPLFFDRMLERVFWADSGLKVIEHTSIDGHDRHLYRQLSASPVAITSVGTELFWTVGGAKRLHHSNKLASNQATKQLDLSDHVYANSRLLLAGITGIDASRSHPCAHNNGNCSHLCLVSPKKDTHMECACPDGMYLKEPTVCGVLTACKRSEFECDRSSVTGLTRHCIPLSQRCNGRQDCPGGEDEDVNMCSAKDAVKVECHPHEFACTDGSRCIDESLVCNLLVDCPDHSDETDGCLSERFAACDASTGRFRCGSGECIGEQNRCDSHGDCRDLSDEQDCETRTCDTETMFRCQSGNCIAKLFECDGDTDCLDGSDEHKDCNYLRTCSPSQMTCDNGQCIDEELKCNGVLDCEDASDERSCPPAQTHKHSVLFLLPTHDTSKPDPTKPDADSPAEPLVCDSRFEFECSSSLSLRCLPKAVRCNGTSECINGEDELDCAGCRQDEFLCRNGKCVYKEWICDKKDDCGDNSDEEVAACQARSGGKPIHDVTKSSMRCFGSFRCASNNECIQEDKVCNGEKDCSDGSDEGGMCDKGCDSAGCSDLCQRTPSGPKCACGKGYELTGDAKTCADIDECATEEYCSQYCTNTRGAFRCSCKYPEFALRDDGMSCKAKGPEMRYLFAVYNEIRTMSGWHSQLGIVHSDPNSNLRVAGLAGDVARNAVYWSQPSNDTLYRVSLHNRRQLVSARVRRPGRVALDWITGNVYVVEANSQITVGNFETQTYATLYKSDPAMNIEALAVDPVMRVMFWSERLAHKLPFSSIYRSDTSGSNVVKIVSSDLTQVADIFIDTFHSQIYWADSVSGKIERANFDGSHRQEVFTPPDMPIDITIFEDYMYVLVQPKTASDMKEMEEIGNVWRCGLYGSALAKCDQFRIHPKHFTTPYHFDIMHTALQLKGHNDCTNSSECLEGGGMCVLRSNKLRPAAVCICPDGTRLRQDNVCPPDQLGAIFSGKVESDPRLTSRNVTTGLSNIWWLLLGFVFVVVPIVGLLFFVYRGGRQVPIQPSCHWMPGFCTRRFPFHSIRFNSKFGMSNVDADDTIPAYSDFQFHPCQLNPGEHQYENPIAAMRDHNGSVTIKTMNEIDIQVGPEKNGWMGIDGVNRMRATPSEAGSDSSTIEMAGVSNGDNCRTLLLQ